MSLSINQLEQGEFISPDSLEVLFEVNRNSTKYSFKCMILCGEISRELTEREGKTVLAIQHKLGLQILTDEETTNYCNGRISKATSDIIKFAQLQSHVGTESMNTDERTVHVRSVEKNMRFADYVKRKARKIGIGASTASRIE